MEFIFKTIFWTLAFYGLFEITKNIIYIFTYTKLRSAKNQENKIECVLRSILFKILYGKEDYFKNIIFSDLESTDNTEEIVKKLSEEYECLKVISWKECKDIIDNVDQN